VRLRFENTDNKVTGCCCEGVLGYSKLKHRCNTRYDEIRVSRSISGVKLALRDTEAQSFPPAPVSHSHQPPLVVDMLYMSGVGLVNLRVLWRRQERRKSSGSKDERVSSIWVLELDERGHGIGRSTLR
jgi:hypothetical protein